MFSGKYLQIFQRLLSFTNIFVLSLYPFSVRCEKGIMLIGDVFVEGFIKINFYFMIHLQRLSSMLSGIANKKSLATVLVTAMQIYHFNNNEERFKLCSFFLIHIYNIDGSRNRTKGAPTYLDLFTNAQSCLATFTIPFLETEPRFFGKFGKNVF